MKRRLVALVAITLTVGCSDQPSSDEPLLGPVVSPMSAGSTVLTHTQGSMVGSSGSRSSTVGTGAAAASRMFWDAAKGAFRAGVAQSSQWDDANVNTHSFATGFNSTASGWTSTALGARTVASGSQSTAMGIDTDATGTSATAIGDRTEASGSFSTAMNVSTLASGNAATAMGDRTTAQALASLVIGRFNVIEGSATTWLSTDPLFVIGNGAGAANPSNAMTVRKNGNVGIGTTVPLDKLHVNGRIRLQTVEYFEDGGTNEIAVRGDLRPTSDNVFDLGTSTLKWDDVYATNGTIITSDIRAKEDVESTTYGLSEVMRMRPVSFRRKGHADQGRKLGLVAQDLLTIMPEVVKTFDYKVDEETEEPQRYELDLYGVNYAQLIPVLIRAIQEQQARIEALESEVRGLR